MRNDLAICDRVANRWCSDDIRWSRIFKIPVPRRLRLAWFDYQIEWAGVTWLDDDG